MAGKGGKTPGAGRKKGSLNKRTVAIAEEAAQKGITPLEVMLEAMWFLYKKENAKEANGVGAVRAAAMAEKCAPYMHPKISNIELTGKNGGPVEFSNLSDVEIDRRLNQLIGSKVGES